MVSRHGWFQPRKNFSAVDTFYPVDEAGTVADIHHAVFIKRDAGGNAQPRSERYYFAGPADAARQPVSAVGDKELAAVSKRDTGRIHNVGRYLFKIAFRFEPEKCHRQM